MMGHRWLAVRPIPLLGLVVALACVPRPVPAQDTLTASLLKRLGSAVDGYRTGRPVWVVASDRFPNEVAGVFFSVDDANSAVLRSGGPPYRRFGPFIAPPDSGLPTIVFALACRGKRLDTSCPPMDSLRTDSLGIRPTRIDDVVSVTLTVRTKDGHSMSTTVPPEDAEAFFLTMSAVDRFLIPYYSQLYGAEYAANLRREYLRRFRRPSEH